MLSSSFWQSVLQATSRGQQDGSELMSALQITNNGQTAAITSSSNLQLQLPALFAKRQGVSGESSDLHHNHYGGHHHSRLIQNNQKQQHADISLLVTSHDKDFRYDFFFFTFPYVRDNIGRRLK